jgi:alkanesulfonate monooxygenase SsuD/methylene tetrahydromethanopterin reductase-like flavin-dependent oxidoreductase (luciferase family)
MKIGLQYPLTMAQVDNASLQRRFADFFREVQWANDQDFAGIWLTEHHFSNYSITPSPMVLLSKVATLAPRLRIGTSIVVLPLWDPVRLAADVAMLDLISNGRLDLGIGRGYQPHEFLGFGKDPQKSREIFEEAVDVLIQLFTAEDKTFEGKHHRVAAPVTLLPKTTQRPYPPIWMASSSPDSIRYAARKGFHFMTPTTWTTPELAVQYEFIGECVSESGGDVNALEFEANRFIFCGTDKTDLEIAIKEGAWMTQLSQSLLRGAVPAKGINAALPTAGDAAIASIKERMIAGTPEQVVEQLRSLADSGVTYVLGQFQFGRLPEEIAKRSRELFAKEALPHVGSLGRKIAKAA